MQLAAKFFRLSRQEVWKFGIARVLTVFSYLLIFAVCAVIIVLVRFIAAFIGLVLVTLALVHGNWHLFESSEMD